MILEGYGIKLKRLQERDIELVRRWRNSPKIRRFMEFRQEITKEQQLQWFQSINNIHNNYMLIETNGKAVGLIHGAGINWEKKETANGGIFIWDQSQWITKVPLSASLLMTDMSSIFGLERTYAKIMKDNPNAIAFNKSLGYQLLPGQEELYAQHYVLSQTDYEERRNSIRSKLLSEFAPYTIHISPSDMSNSINQFYIDILERTSSERRIELNFELKGIHV